MARETTPLEPVPPSISDSAPARVPRAPVEAAAHTLAERTGALNLPLYKTLTRRPSGSGWASQRCFWELAPTSCSLPPRWAGNRHRTRSLGLPLDQQLSRCAAIVPTSCPNNGCLLKPCRASRRRAAMPQPLTTTSSRELESSGSTASPASPSRGCPLLVWRTGIRTPCIGGDTCYGRRRTHEIRVSGGSSGINARSSLWEPTSRRSWIALCGIYPDPLGWLTHSDGRTRRIALHGAYCSGKRTSPCCVRRTTNGNYLWQHGSSASSSVSFRRA